MIIGIGYKKRSGKDKFAALLLDALQREPSVKSVRVVGFGDEVKNIAYSLYKHKGLKTGAYYEEHPDEKEQKTIALGDKTVSPRYIWIVIGTMFRELYEDTWLEKVVHQYEDHPQKHLIIKDVRFRNEADAILARGGKLIRMERADIPQGTDAAEIDLDGYENWTIAEDNNGTLRDLAKAAEKLAGELLHESR